ncbi:MAG: pyruvate, water dikinase regulatory protein [Myxococcota bacterium]|nr:pyruvate, water dikinase regulatory protein [Myxococcota bacterium]
MTTQESTRRVFILADGTGETAEKVSTAALTQFPGNDVETVIHTRVRSKIEIREIMEKAAAERAFVVYTVIDPEHRDYIQRLAEEAGVEVADVIGSLVVRLGTFLQSKPMLTPGIQHQLDEEYFRRIEAVEFAVKNDDGQAPHNLHRADMILVGLSRTSKTPLSMYLAHRGYKCANVPMVPDIPLPAELFQIDQQKIFGLIIDLNTLVRVRSERLKHLGLPPDAEYAARENIARELRWCREFYARNPAWPIIDTSGRAVEETAAEMIRIKNEREKRNKSMRPTSS